MADSEVDLSGVSLAKLQEEILKRTHPAFPPPPSRLAAEDNEEALQEGSGVGPQVRFNPCTVKR